MPRRCAWQRAAASWPGGRPPASPRGSGNDVELVIVTTTGDHDRTDVPIHAVGGTGVFVKEVQQAVLDGRADLAVHSAKDLPASGRPTASCSRPSPSAPTRATRWSGRPARRAPRRRHGRYRVGAAAGPARRARPDPHVRRAAGQRPDAVRAGRRVRRRRRRRGRARAGSASPTGPTSSSTRRRHAPAGRPGRAGGRVPDRRRRDAERARHHRRHVRLIAAVGAERAFLARARRRLRPPVGALATASTAVRSRSSPCSPRSTGTWCCGRRPAPPSPVDRGNRRRRRPVRPWCTLAPRRHRRLRRR